MLCWRRLARRCVERSNLGKNSHIYVVQAGPHNVYDIYDSTCHSVHSVVDRCPVDCPNTAIFLNKTGKSMRWLRNYLRENMNDPVGAAKQLTELSGGYQWSCGAMDDMTQFFSKAEVQKVSQQQRNYPYFQLTLFGTRLFT